MAIDFSGADQELQNAGIDPEQAGRLLNFMRPRVPSVTGVNMPPPEVPLSTGITGGRLNFGSMEPPAPPAAGPRLFFGRTGSAMESQPTAPSRLNFATAPQSAMLPSERTLGAQNSDAALAMNGTNKLAVARRMEAARAGGGTAPQIYFGGPTAATRDPGDFGSTPGFSDIISRNAWRMATANGGASRTGAAAAPAYTPGPAEQRFQQLEAQGAPNLHGWKKWMDIAGQILAPGVEERIPGTPGNYNARAMGMAKAALAEQKLRAGQNEDMEAQARTRLTRAQTREAEDRAGQLEQPDNAADKKIDEYMNSDGQRVLIFQKPGGDTYEKSFGDVQQKPDRITNPFEAFAYGSTEERKAAQDFIKFEKRIGSQYEKPGEIEQRYALYQKDPAAYKAMFGDRGGSQDAANASRMLTYFDRRRREVENDWTLDEKQKADQLAEIDQLSQPYLNAAQPNGATKSGPAEDRVTVRDKDGNVGTVPRSKLNKALKKGYSLIQ